MIDPIRCSPMDAAGLPEREQRKHLGSHAAAAVNARMRRDIGPECSRRAFSAADKGSGVSDFP